MDLSVKCVTDCAFDETIQKVENGLKREIHKIELQKYNSSVNVIGTTTMLK